MTASQARSVPGLDLTAAVVAIVRGVLQDHVPTREVWAFGSRVKGSAKPYSDLDLVVLGNEPLTLEEIAALNGAFSESDMPIKVDLVDWASASDNFRAIMRQDHVVLQAAQPQP